MSTPWIPIFMAQDPVLRGRGVGPCGSQASKDDRGQLGGVTLSSPHTNWPQGPGVETWLPVGWEVWEGCLVRKGRWPDSLLQGPLSTGRGILGRLALRLTPGEGKDGRGPH